jgi:hypothetical protein
MHCPVERDISSLHQVAKVTILKAKKNFYLAGTGEIDKSL